MEQPKKLPNLTYNGEIHLAIGSSKTEKKWKNRSQNWSDFLQRLATPTVTQETVNDYKKIQRANRTPSKMLEGLLADG